MSTRDTVREMQQRLSILVILALMATSEPGCVRLGYDQRSDDAGKSKDAVGAPKIDQPTTKKDGVGNPKKDMPTVNKDQGQVKKDKGATKKDKGTAKKDLPGKPPDKGTPPDKKWWPDTKPWHDLVKWPPDKTWHDKFVPPTCGVGCNGCCNSNTCLPFNKQSAKKCGVGGQNCGPCGPGLGCVNGKCICGKGSLCSGCCEGNTCRKTSQQSTTKCGSSGNTCAACSKPATCKAVDCLNGSCVTVNEMNGYACLGIGMCYNGSCCSGCISGSTCLTGTKQTATKCGSGGGSCKACAATNPCKSVACVNQSCNYSNKSNGTGCVSGGNAGECTGGTCCTGCRQSSVCYGGGGDALCGKSGETCKDCTNKSAPVCQKYTCVNNTCTIKQSTNGSACSSGGVGGTCKNGVCCTGCTSGSKCEAGTAVSKCGIGGAACSSCIKAIECKHATCVSGVCGLVSAADGTTCASGLGACYNGTCCTGCIANNQCHQGTEKSFCGLGGINCKTCKSGELCDNGVCGVPPP